MKTLLKVSIAATAAYTAAWIVLWISTPTKLKKKKISTESTYEKPVYNFFDIPGPTGVPLFGSLFLFVPYVLRNRADLYFTFLHKVHGTILKFNILGKYIFLVSDAKLIKSLTNNTSDAIIRDDQLAIAANGVFDNSLFIIPSGPIWKKHRKGIQPAFGPYHLREVSKICLNKADELLDIWTESLVDGKTHRNVQQDFHVMAGDIIVKFALDADFGALKKLKENSVSETLELLDDLAHVFSIRVLVNIPWIWPLFNVSTSRPSETTNKLKKILEPYIHRKRESLTHRMKTNPNWNDEKMKRDFLDRLVLPQSAAQSLGVTFSDEEIIGEVVGFFGAGQETSTQAMTFLVYELCENEGVQSKLVKEIDDVLGGNIPTLDILPSLKYLDAVVKETLRFHTILPQMLRVTAQEFSANSDDGSIFLFPKNSTVFIDCEAVHHSKTYWGDDVDVFKPERWLANGEEFVPVPGSFLPFGDGPMNCIGQKVALIEIKITMIRLLQEFKIRHSPKQGPVVLINTVTSGLKHGLIVEIEKK